MTNEVIDVEVIRRILKEQKEDYYLSIQTEDAISRQAALDVIAETDITNGTEPVFTGKQVQSLLRDLPPVTPKQRTGRWEIISGNNSRCSICGVYNPPDYSNRPVIYNYCPFCGAKMESEV